MRVGKNSLQGYRNPKFGQLNLRKLKAKKIHYRPLIMSHTLACYLKKLPFWCKFNV